MKKKLNIEFVEMTQMIKKTDPKLDPCPCGNCNCDCNSGENWPPDPCDFLPIVCPCPCG